MIGSIIGDIVGSVYEFTPNNIKTKEFKFFNENGSYTDDSILTIATADWLLHGGEVAHYYSRYGEKYPWPMGGYGGAIKQLSIGLASSYGKAYIHGASIPENIWTVNHDSFLESMADAATSVVKLFNNKIVYINVLSNMSVDCDCCSIAEDPCMKDIGIVLSTDPIAIDQACLDLVYNSTDPGREHLIERIESRNGIHLIETAANKNLGNIEYELIDVDK